jgi:hypothetical protein
MRHSQACILFRRHTIMNYTNTRLEGLNPGQGHRRDQEADGGAASLIPNDAPQQ